VRAAEIQAAQALERERLQARERDAALKKQRTLERVRSQAPNLEETRRRAREKWLAYRAGMAEERAPAASKAAEMPIPAAVMSSLSAEERQSVENWLEYRRQQLESGREREAHETAPVVGARESGAVLSLGEDDREHEDKRVARLTAQELRQEIHDRRPESLSLLVEQDEAVRARVRASVERRERLAQAHERERQAQREAAEWRQGHALQVKLHDLKLKSAEYLETRAAMEAEARAERLAALTQQELAEVELARARAVAAQRIAIETAPARARIAQLERVLKEKVRLEGLARDFQALAQRRAMQQPGTLEHSAEWQATPAVLRAAIERFNQLPAAAQASSVQALVAQPEVVESLGQALAQRHEQRLDHDHGLGL
jgi:hypothetical protein